MRYDLDRHLSRLFHCGFFAQRDFGAQRNIPSAFAGHASMGTGPLSAMAVIPAMGPVHGGLHGHADLTHISVFNFGTIAAFLTWFGGVGYLLSKYSGLLFWVAFSLSTIGGIVGAAIVFLFLTRVLLAHERPLNALDYEMVGVYGQLTSAIREGGTGEISFSQEGVRRGAPARSDDGTAIQKNTESW